MILNRQLGIIAAIGTAGRFVRIAAALSCTATLLACGGGAADTTVPAPNAGIVAYVASATSGTVSLHDVDANGVLVGAARAAAASGSSPQAFALHPSGKFLYVANFLSFDLSAFKIDAKDATLSAVQAPVSTGDGFFPSALAAHPSGRFAYVATVQNNLVPARITPYPIDPASGALGSPRAGAFAGVAPSSIAVTPSGAFAYATDPDRGAVWGFAIDGTTGDIRNLDSTAPVATGASPAAVAVDAAGRYAYVVNQGSGVVAAYAIDAAAGTLTPISQSITALEPQAIAIDPSNRFVYVANSGSNSVSMYRIAASGGLAPLGSPVPAGKRPLAIAVDPTGRFVLTVNARSSDISAFAIDPSTGVLLAAGATGPTGAVPLAIAIRAPAIR
jgi:6-phosphogluconolactonase